ncbi:MAG: helix-turn-helix transcriptional regulator [Methylococcales bacterium]|nr:helix-turn-helix transcriptional regulator [Methylococcales bacterium]
MSVQFIENNGCKEYAILPIDVYNQLLEKAELLEDVAAYEKAKQDDDELIPSDIVNRLLRGENKIKVWREYRQLTQAALADKSDIAQATIAQMEGGKRIGSVTVLKKIAVVLQLDLDDLV